MKRYQAIASRVGARLRCIKASNADWASKQEDAIRALCDELPHGSGFDSGTHLDLDRSTGDRLVFTTSYHHMNDGGMYDGWTEHTITVVPSLELGYHVRINGRNRNDIKDYIAQCMSEFLDAELAKLA